MVLFLGQILLLICPYNFHPPSTEVVMVAAGIVVADTAVDMGYTGPHSETMAPLESAAQAETEAQPETVVQPGIEAQPGIAFVSVQSLFAPWSSLDMHLLFSLRSW